MNMQYAYNYIANVYNLSSTKLYASISNSIFSDIKHVYK